MSQMNPSPTYMKAIVSSETLVISYQTKRHHVSEKAFLAVTTTRNLNKTRIIVLEP
jgi:hypothetical protein